MELTRIQWEAGMLPFTWISVRRALCSSAHRPRSTQRRTGDIHAMVGFHVRIAGIRQTGNDGSCKRIHLSAQGENCRLQC